MKVTKSQVGAGALAIGGMLAFAVPAGAAVNLQSESEGSASIKIVKTAKLKAAGAATVVTANVTCPAGSSYQLYVNVTQTIGNKTTTGSGHDNSNCTGALQKVKVHVTVANGGAPFKLGLAYATGELGVYIPNYGYVNLNTGREILNVN